MLLFSTYAKSQSYWSNKENVNECVIKIPRNCIKSKVYSLLFGAGLCLILSALQLRSPACESSRKAVKCKRHAAGSSRREITMLATYSKAKILNHTFLSEETQVLKIMLILGARDASQWQITSLVCVEPCFNPQPHKSIFKEFYESQHSFH